jgi:Winged helix DNA-binding domain
VDRGAVGAALVGADASRAGPLHPDQADEVIAAIGDALADTELTVHELTEAIVERTGPWAGERTMAAFQDVWPRWRQLTSTAAHRGVLDFGANQGRNVTYTNPHRWLPGIRPDDGEAALRTLVTRFLYAYGPATPQHFARWLSIPPRRAVELFDELAGALECVWLDGELAWTTAGDARSGSESYISPSHGCANRHRGRMVHAASVLNCAWRCSARRLLESDSGVADVMVGPGSPEHPHDHPSGQYEGGGQ